MGDDFDRAFVEDDLSKLSVLLTIAASFLIGIFVGTHLHKSMKEWTFLVPASITGIAGVAYSIYRVVILHQNFFSDAEMEAIDIPAEIQGEVVQDGSVTCDIPTSDLSGQLSARHSQVGHVMSVSRKTAAQLEQTHAGLDLHHH